MCTSPSSQQRHVTQNASDLLLQSTLTGHDASRSQNAKKKEVNAGLNLRSPRPFGTVFAPAFQRLTSPHSTKPSTVPNILFVRIFSMLWVASTSRFGIVGVDLRK